jgi:hypothetical protein
VRRRRRGRRVVTPDGYVWFVRRRRARRRPFWVPRSRYPERFHGEEELPDPDERIPLPGPLDLFTTRGEDLGQPGWNRFAEADRYRGWVALEAIAATTVLVTVVVTLFGIYVLPWLVGFTAGHARPLLSGAAVLAGLAALNQLHRPWYVELQRQGLAGAPRRVWRVQGWRRSGRLMRQLVAAVREGRVDRRGTVLLPADDRR